MTRSKNANKNITFFDLDRKIIENIFGGHQFWNCLENWEKNVKEYIEQNILGKKKQKTK